MARTRRPLTVQPGTRRPHQSNAACSSPTINFADQPRHIAVDTCGLLLTVLVTGAHVQDRDAARVDRPGPPSLGDESGFIRAWVAVFPIATRSLACSSRL
jgi:hypothetical protein